jgi:hypothetical protein
VRPSVSDQLEGISRILVETIAPQVIDPYCTGVLEGLIASLDSLASGWKKVPRFLRWDTDETAVILGVALPYLAHGLADCLRAALDEAPPAGDLDLGALEAHHRRMRMVLEQAVPAIVDRPDLRDRLVSHLIARARQFPVSTIPIAPPARTGGSVAHPA